MEELIFLLEFNAALHSLPAIAFVRPHGIIKEEPIKFPKKLQKFVAVSRSSFKKCSADFHAGIYLYAQLCSMLMQNECIAHDSVKLLARTVLALKYDTFRKRENRHSIIKGVTYSIL